MRKIGLRKTFIYVFAFLLTLCALLSFVLFGNKKSETVTAEAATFTTLSGHSDWSVSDTTGSGSLIENSYGHGWSSNGAFQLKSTRKAWVDKFGLAFHSAKADATTFYIAVSPEVNTWYSDSSSSIKLEITYSGSSSATVGIWCGTTGLASFSGLYMDWSGNYENNVYFGKTASGWSVNINNVEKALGSTESSKLDTALSAYTNKVGYLQIENMSGGMQFTYVSVLFGMPSGGSGSMDKAPTGFSKTILSDPYWNTISGTEVAAWSPQKNTLYTVASTKAMPLKGMEIDLRMAPAEVVTRNIIAFTSLYHHNWYAGTYTIAFNFDYNPAVHGDSYVSLQFMVYTPTTEATGEQAIKITQQVRFNWYETNKFQFYKSKGVWGIKLNGEDIFVDALDSDGLSVDDHFKRVESYYDGNAAYLQMWGRGNGVDTAVPYDGFVVEYMKGLSETTDGVEIAPNLLNFAELQIFEFQTNIQLRIAMSDLFTVTGSTEVEYFTTCGIIQSNGVWAYTARGVGEQWVTLKCIAGGQIEEYRVKLIFIQGPEVVAPETASLVQEASFENGVITVSTTSGGAGESSTQQGCSSSVASGATFALAAAAVAVLMKKRRKD